MIKAATKRILIFLLATLVIGQACQPTSSVSVSTSQSDLTNTSTVPRDEDTVTTSHETLETRTHHVAGLEEANEESPPEYLTEVIPPCTPINDTVLDPCLPQEPTGVQRVASDGLEGLPHPLPTLDDILLGRWSATGTAYPSLVPHIVIRGIPLSGTTRCHDYPLEYSDYRRDPSSFAEIVFHVHCFAQVRVSEYLVGTGPPELTVSLHREIVHLPTDGGYRESFIAQHGGEDHWVNNALDYPAVRTADVYEGKELVLLLRVSGTIAVETWETELLMGVWFVQRSGDDPPRAVDRDIRLALTAEQRARLDLTLAELERQVRAASANRLAVTDGRIGVASDLPLLVTDANKLSSFYGAVGAVYDDPAQAPATPPPVPGGDEPEGPPANTGGSDGGDDQTPPVPGDDDEQPPNSVP